MADRLEHVVTSSFWFVGLLIVAALGVLAIVWLKRRMVSDGEHLKPQRLLAMQGPAFWLALLTELQTGTTWRQWPANQWMQVVTYAGGELPACPPALCTTLHAILVTQRATISDTMISSTLSLLIGQLEHRKAAHAAAKSHHNGAS
jgi:hypothetical protein